MPVLAYQLTVALGKLHLHPISQTHQLRPTLTYLDVLSRRSKRARGGASDSESEDGPPADPDEPHAPVEKKEKKPTSESREVQVSARKIEDKGAAQVPGSLSAVRKEILQAIRAEEDVSWEDLQFYDVSVRNHEALENVHSTALQTIESEQAFERIFSQNDEELECPTNMTAFLREIHGL